MGEKDYTMVKMCKGKMAEMEEGERKEACKKALSKMDLMEFCKNNEEECMKKDDPVNKDDFIKFGAFCKVEKEEWEKLDMAKKAECKRILMKFKDAKMQEDDKKAED